MRAGGPELPGGWETESTKMRTVPLTVPLTKRTSNLQSRGHPHIQGGPSLSGSRPWGTSWPGPPRATERSATQSSTKEGIAKKNRSQPLEPSRNRWEHLQSKGKRDHSFSVREET